MAWRSSNTNGAASPLAYVATPMRTSRTAGSTTIDHRAPRSRGHGDRAPRTRASAREFETVNRVVLIRAVAGSGQRLNSGLDEPLVAAISHSRPGGIVMRKTIGFVGLVVFLWAPGESRA